MTFVAVRGLELEPGAAVGDDLRVGQVAARRRVLLAREVDAGRAHQLGDDDALGAVDDEGAGGRHEREVAHEQLLLLHLARLLDDELDADAQGRGVGGVAVAALALVVLRLAEGVLAEAQLHLGAGEVLDGRDLVEQLTQALALEPVVGVELNLDQVRHLHDLGDLGVRLLQRGHALAEANDFSGKRHRRLLLRRSLAVGRLN